MKTWLVNWNYESIEDAFRSPQPFSFLGVRNTGLGNAVRAAAEIKHGDLVVFCSLWRRDPREEIRGAFAVAVVDYPLGDAGDAVARGTWPNGDYVATHKTSPTVYSRKEVPMPKGLTSRDKQFLEYGTQYTIYPIERGDFSLLLQSLLELSQKEHEGDFSGDPKVLDTELEYLEG